MKSYRDQIDLGWISYAVAYDVSGPRRHCRSLAKTSSIVSTSRLVQKSEDSLGAARSMYEEKRAGAKSFSSD